MTPLHNYNPVAIIVRRESANPPRYWQSPGSVSPLIVPVAIKQEKSSKARRRGRRAIGLLAMR